MYGRSQRGMHVRTPVLGGTPITEKQAVVSTERKVVDDERDFPPTLLCHRICNTGLHRDPVLSVRMQHATR